MLYILNLYNLVNDTSNLVFFFFFIIFTVDHTETAFRTALLRIFQKTFKIICRKIIILQSFD